MRIDTADDRIVPALTNTPFNDFKSLLHLHKFSPNTDYYIKYFVPDE